MQETAPATFTVAVGETIDIRVTPIGTGSFVAASLDGSTLSALPGSEDAPHFQFVAGPSGTGHALGLEFSFPGNEPGSRYDVSITGSAGGASGFPIGVNNPVKDTFLEFNVA